MKRLLTSTLFLIAVLLNTVAQAITLDKSSLQLNPGETYSLKIYYYGQEESVDTYESYYDISSSNPTIATVSTKGLVTAIASGTCTITVFAHNGVSKNVKVTVK